MVKIKIIYKDNKYQTLEMSGHANSAEYGQDLVCAGLTAIVSGAMNTFDINFKNDININVLKNKIIIQVNNLMNDKLQTMFEMLKIQLDTIAIQYPKNAELKEVR